MIYPKYNLNFTFFCAICFLHRLKVGICPIFTLKPVA